MHKFTTTTLSVSLSAALLVSGVGQANASALIVTEEPSDDEAYEALTEEAALRYEKGDYAASVALFERAYEIRPEPNILFNMGRIEEEAGNLEEAIRHYERFIQDASADYDDRQDGLERLNLLRELVAIKKRQDNPDEPQPQQPPDESQPQQPQPQQPQPQGPQVEGPQQPPGDTTKPPPDPRKLRIAGYTVLGLGAVALIAGGVAAGVARGKQGQLDTTAPDLEARREIEAKGINAARAADGMFVVGSLLAVTGIVILLLPQSRAAKNQDQQRATLVPSFGKGQAGIGVRGRF